MSKLRSVDVKLNVRPIYIGLIHQYVFEGPCRFGKGAELTSDFDAMMAQQEYKDFQENLAKYLPAASVNLMEPVYVERYESFLSPDAMFDAMGKDSDQVDLYFIYHEIGRGDIVIEFAQRVKKPILISPDLCCNIANDIAAIKGRGLECYACMTWEDTAKFMEVLRARKAIREMNCLLAPRMSSTMAMSSVSTFIDLETVTARFGTKFRYINAHELLDMTMPVEPDENHTLPGRREHNITADDMAQIKELAAGLVAGASACAMELDKVENSVRAYWTVKKLLDVYDCNAFSIPCPDVCATRRLNQEKFTFCLNHSLMNENGIPSACEYDIGGLLSMAILMNISRKAPYLGNVNPVRYKDGVAQPGRALFAPDIKLVENEQNLYHIFHATPNRRLRGLDEPYAPYSIQPFAHSGFGATIRYDFKQDRGQVVTLARVSPAADRLMIARGTVMSGGGCDVPNCTLNMVFKVEDAKDFFKKQVCFGNHLPMVYGDYMEELKELGEIMGLEVVTA